MTENHDATTPSPEPEGERTPPTVGGPLDGTPQGCELHVLTGPEAAQARDRGLDHALERAGLVMRGLWDWLSDVDTDGSGNGRTASEDGRLLARMVDQFCTMCRLVELSIGERRENGETGLSWILLEQARRQLGHAVETLGVARGALPEEDVWDVAARLRWLLHRDLSPEPEHAGQRVEFAGGVTTAPDLRPESPMELVPLQFLAAAALRWGTVVAGPMPPVRIDDMAYGHYLALLLEEAMELLEARARRHGDGRLVGYAEEGLEAAGVVWATTPEPWEVFPPIREEPDAA